MMKKLIIIPAIVLFLPLFADASSSTGGGGGIYYFSSMVSNIRAFIAQIIPVIVAIALVLFLFGLLTYLFSTDPKKKEGAKGFIVWGIVILFVMTTVWGLVSMFGKILGLDNENNAPRRAPALPTSFNQ